MKCAEPSIEYALHCSREWHHCPMRGRQSADHLYTSHPRVPCNRITVQADRLHPQVLRKGKPTRSAANGCGRLRSTRTASINERIFRTLSVIEKPQVRATMCKSRKFALVRQLNACQFRSTIRIPDAFQFSSSFLDWTFSAKNKPRCVTVARERHRRASLSVGLQPIGRCRLGRNRKEHPPS